MKFPDFFFTALAFTVGIILIAGTVSAAADEYQKCFVIHVNISEGHFTCSGSRITYSTTPHLNPYGGNLTGVITGDRGVPLTTFTLFDPRIQFGDAVIGNMTNGSGVVCDRTSLQKNLDFVVEFPFDPDARVFQLYDKKTGTLLFSENLSKVSAEFFRKYPRDPDNPGRVSPGPPEAPVQETGEVRSPEAIPAGSPDTLAGGVIVSLAAAVFFRRTR